MLTINIITYHSKGVSIMKFNSISDALIELRRGKLVIVVDDEDRENE